jgi:nucleoside-diphosphate-sugar epimerase
MPASASLAVHGLSRSAISEVCCRALPFFKGDIRDSAVVEQAVAGADLIFHPAGKSGPAASNTSPLEDLDVNGRGQLILLEACRRYSPAAKIVYPSSRLVYAPSAKLHH